MSLLGLLSFPNCTPTRPYHIELGRNGIFSKLFSVEDGCFCWTHRASLSRVPRVRFALGKFPQKCTNIPSSTVPWEVHGGEGVKKTVKLEKRKEKD